jgi:DNA topoisomerase VI subunit A
MKEQFIDHTFARRSAERLQLVNGILDEYSAQGFDLSLRQLYYQLVARDYIENSQASYKRLGDLLNKARLAGLVDWQMIVDRSRDSKVNQHWDNPGQIVRAAAYGFRIDKWKNQPCHIEVMVEKDALTGVLLPVCKEEDIYFTANKGYPSASILYQMSKRIIRHLRDNKDVYILHLGDHDPSGLDMTRDLADRLELFCGVTLQVVRLALNMEQVMEYNPPENPAKVTDSRARAYIHEFGPNSWELDALEPRVLAELVSEQVARLRDDVLWAEAIDEEREMRDELEQFAAGYGV